MSKIVRFALATASGILLYLQLHFLFSGNFDDFLYSDYSLLLFAPLILFILPLTTFGFRRCTVGKNEKGAKMAILLSFAAPIIIGPCFGFWAGKHEKKLYAKYGVKTWGIVDKAYYSKGYLIRYYFYLNGIQISALANNPLRHKEGDTVEVIYNSKYPDMYTTVENL